MATIPHTHEVPDARVIGLTGHAGAGKDAVAAMLADYGYHRLALADILREAALLLDPLVGPDTLNLERVRLSDVVDKYGWDTAKRLLPEVRRTLQRLGDAVRLVDVDAFVRHVRQAVAAAPHARVVVTDIRYLNELAVLPDPRCLVEVVRPGVGPVNGHSSETPLPADVVGATIYNEGTLDDLRADVRYLAERWHFLEAPAKPHYLG